MASKPFISLSNPLTGTAVDIADAPASIARDARLAILSVHTHGDRSFLDDQQLALLSGDLRAMGIDNDLVLVVLDPAGGEGIAGVAAEDKLVEVLRAFDVVVYERVWNRALIEKLVRALPDKVFISARGEHLMDAPIAHWVTTGRLRGFVPALLRHLRGDAPLPPSGTLHSKQKRLVPPFPGDLPGADDVRHEWEPNLRPVIVNPEALPANRTFSITGNKGCPYQADARENPLFAGTEIPEQYGRGCGFCVTGNTYEARPNTETAESVHDQVRYVRTHAPELRTLVLKDQNPFGYLTELVERLAAEQIGDFTLLLETRADWFLRSQKRFEQALTAAASAKIVIAPYLIGIESFSQAELDRFNKGIDAATNIRFLESVTDWEQRFPASFTLKHASFGFILFSPWTTRADLRANLEGIRRTRFDRFRGSVLLSRARLYPDTALYWLAKRDGLLAESFRNADEDNSRRYGYFPFHPWRFQHAETEHLADLAVEVAKRNDNSDQVALLGHLLDAFDAAADWKSVTADEVIRRYKAAGSGRSGGGVIHAKQPESLVPATADVVEKVTALVPASTLQEGWTVARVETGGAKLRIRLEHPTEDAIVVDLTPRTEQPAYARTKHWSIVHANRSLSQPQARAMKAFAEAAVRNDR